MTRKTSFKEELRREYERKLTALKLEQNRCIHEWGEVEYDPEIKSEPYGCRTVNQGSDIWCEPEGYHNVTYKRWSRTCKKCGKVEYTKKHNENNLNINKIWIFEMQDGIRGRFIIADSEEDAMKKLSLDREVNMNDGSTIIFPLNALDLNKDVHDLW